MTPKETCNNNNCQANPSAFYDLFDAYNEGPAFCHCDRGKKKEKTNEVDQQNPFCII